MAALTVNTLVDAGTKPTFVAASASDTAVYGTGHDTYLHYKNTSGSPVNVTVVVPGSNAYSQPNPDPVLVLAATTGELLIPLRKEYDDGNGTGTATVTTSAQTNVTVALVRMS